MLTKMKMRQLVKSGAMHPICLVRDQLIESASHHPLWRDIDFTKFPWPRGRTLWDLVAHVCQKELLRIAASEKHYFNMLEQIEVALFGKSNPERISI